jgi:hypothetical protein
MQSTTTTATRTQRVSDKSISGKSKVDRELCSISQRLALNFLLSLVEFTFRGNKKDGKNVIDEEGGERKGSLKLKMMRSDVNKSLTEFSPCLVQMKSDFATLSSTKPKFLPFKCVTMCVMGKSELSRIKKAPIIPPPALKRDINDTHINISHNFYYRSFVLLSLLLLLSRVVIFHLIAHFILFRDSQFVFCFSL